MLREDEGREMHTVLVTGANGFIGKAVCTHLVDCGWLVRAVVRDSTKASQLPARLEVHAIVDPLSSAHWERLVAGVDAVVHLAGRCHKLDESPADALVEHRRANVDVTREILEASHAAGVRRFVFMSSIAAVGSGSAAVYTEETPCKPAGAYGLSKLEAENIVLDCFRASGLECVVLRAPAVYGRGMKGNVPRLIELIQRRIPLPLGAVGAPRSMLCIGNLASAIETCLRHPAASGEIFHVADNDALTAKELVLELGTLLGVKVRLIPVPLMALRLAGTVLRRQEDVRRVTEPLLVSHAKLTRMLDWQPNWTARQGLAETIGSDRKDSAAS
jgi:UDP-glucose 4-epimerase